MLFFNLNRNRKFIINLFLGALVFTSCSGPKRAQVSTNTKRTSETVTKKEVDDDARPANTAVAPDEKDDEDSDKKEKSSDKAEKVISTARTFIGTPYKYGGMTRSGMDCSGLLINSFTVVKVNLPRSS